MFFRGSFKSSLASGLVSSLFNTRYVLLVAAAFALSEWTCPNVERWATSDVVKRTVTSFYAWSASENRMYKAAFLTQSFERKHTEILR
jgi:hypothetical protein